MKTQAIVLFAFVTLVTAISADTPDAILADYRSKASAALETLNDKLEDATVPIIADLVKVGDTAGAELVRQQLKDKQKGEPIMKAHFQVATLFAQYDSAKIKSLEPLQKAAVSRINAMLTSSGSKTLGVVEDLGKVRHEIEADGALSDMPKIPAEWSYHTSVNGRSMGRLKLQADGSFDLEIPTATMPHETGTWKPSKKKNTLYLTCRDEKWEILIDGENATIKRPTIGVRWLKVLNSR